MNNNLQKLFTIAQKKERLIIGLMSGTSLDGLDIALCRFKGSGLETQCELLHFYTYPYSEAMRLKIKDIFSKEMGSIERLCLLNTRLANIHSKMILETLRHWKVNPEEIDCIASHGQTIYHAPKRLHQKPHITNATLQITDADHIAYKTKIITISDFRQKHIAAGGEGAPLAVYGDYLLYSKKGENRILLNMGGIANFTYLPENQNPEEVFATDTGPGNTLIDQAVSKYLPPMLYDDEGMIAQQGEVNQALLQKMKSDSFFKYPPPKTTGPELFNVNFFQKAQNESDTLMLNTKDLLATLTCFSAETIAEAILAAVPKDKNYQVYLSGGGAKNTTLTNRIKELMSVGFEFHNFNKLGISSDAKEAVIFALLANESLSNNGIQLGKDSKAYPAVNMGKFSFPN